MHTLDKRAYLLLLTTLLTGLLAGVFFTWSNAITPGIGRLRDLGYLQAFQQMNRTIINPLFYIVIIGPLLLAPLSAYLFRKGPSFVFLMTSGASILYFLGVFVVTMLGNVPLNIILEQAQLSHMSAVELQQLRAQFEAKWNLLHLIRTVTSTGSFALLLVACMAWRQGN